MFVQRRLFLFNHCSDLIQTCFLTDQKGSVTARRKTEVKCSESQRSYACACVAARERVCVCEAKVRSISGYNAAVPQPRKTQCLDEPGPLIWAPPLDHMAMVLLGSPTQAQTSPRPASAQLSSSTESSSSEELSLLATSSATVST